MLIQSLIFSAHPNLLFFVTHGGYLSSIEALHFGVPIIGVPVYFDQFININKAVKKGYALMAELNVNLARNLQEPIQKMLTDSRYAIFFYSFNFTELYFAPFCINLFTYRETNGL